MDINELFKEDKTEHISAFAYNTARMIERLIHDKSKSQITSANSLQAKILIFRQMLTTSVPENGREKFLKKYDEHFGLTEIQ